VSEIDKDYELRVLKMVVNKYLDETISATEESLKALETNRDQFVWELATRIYSQSGNKVELCRVRDIVNSRIGAMKYQLAAEKERIAEPTQSAAEEARLRDKITSILGEFREDEGRAKVFVRLRKIISEQLGVDESKVALNSHLSNDLGADDLDLVEVVMTLEEEFDIEIPDEAAESYLGIYPSSSSGSFWSMLGSISACSSSCSSSRGAGENCIVENFLDFICAKVSV